MRLLALVLLAALAPSLSAEPPLVFKVARILPVSGPAIAPGVLVVRDGKIAAIGAPDDVRIPEGAEVRDLPTATIIPGLVDSHSHIGVYSRPSVPANSDGNEMSGPVQPGVRALDALTPDDPGIRMAVAGGVTVANVMPGSGNVIGGQTVYVKLRGRTVAEMRVEANGVVGGLKMANGENPKGYGRKGQAPFTRMKVAALQREQFVKAREYLKKWQKHYLALVQGEKSTVPDTDLALEPLVEVLQRKRTVHFHCHRADDILTALRMSEEFDFELVLQHATEAYQILDELKRSKASLSLTLLDSAGGKAETLGLIEENAALLVQAGLPVALNTDDYVTESRFMLRTGAMAARGGLSEADALRALTLAPAKMMHLDGRLGSLEAGKDADFVVLSGAPFSVYTSVLETYIDGVRRFRRSDSSDRAYQTGGFALPAGDSLPLFESAKPLAALGKLDTSKNPESGRITALRVGRIHTLAGPPILDGVIILDGGTIKAIGTAKDVLIPEGALVLTAQEATPGLIDAYSMVGLSGAVNIPADQDQDEASDPNQADLRAADAFNPQDTLLEFLRGQGVTILHACPGRTNALAGQSGLFRTAGTSLTDMTVRFPAAVVVNLGEAPKAAYPGKAPHTRMGTAALVRTAFNQAKQYGIKKEADPATPMAAKSEALLLALKGQVPVLFTAHRSDDLLTALRLADEFRLKPILGLATEGYRHASELVKAGVPVVAQPTMQRAAGSMETLHGFTGNAAVLRRAGVPTSIGTGFEGYVPKTRVLRYEAAMALTAGLSHDEALRAVALEPAKLLGLAEKYGSLEVGKVADIVLYDGDPLEHATHVEATIMGGRVVYRRADYLKLPYARRALFGGGSVGGGPGCCLGW